MSKKRKNRQNRLPSISKTFFWLQLKYSWLVETESGSVDNSDLHVLEDVKVVAEFAGAWPWLDSNAPRPLLQKPGVKYIVEDSFQPDSPARQYR